MPVLKVFLAMALGLMSIVIGEVSSVLLMQTAPPSIDLTGNFFLLVASPGILSAVFISAILMLRLLRQNAGLYVAAYATTYMATFAALLLARGNPAAHILSYAAIITMTIAAVIGTATYWVRRH